MTNNVRTITALVITSDDLDDQGVRAITDDLATLQSLVGGYIEGVYGYRRPDATLADAPRLVFYCNEEGKLRNLPVNRLATSLWWHYNPDAVHAHVLCGTVAITGINSRSGNNASIPGDLVKAYRRALLVHTAAS
jgi:hypothetical protein